METTLVLPLLVLLMLNVVNFGIYIYAWVTVNNAARALLEYRVYTGVVLGFPSTPSVAQLQAVVTSETSSLPNSASVTWGICGNANGTTTFVGPGPNPACGSSDPTQPTKYTIYTARVSYTFTPLFPGVMPTFPAVSQQVWMRSMQ